ncbi:MAG: DUF4430 domain-containing protein [Microgenomates group bacterium]
MRKTNILALFFVALIVGTGYLQFFPKKEPQKKVAPTPTILVQQKITAETVLSNRQEQVQKGATALQALNSTHKIKSKGVGQNTFVTAIDGREALADKQEFWAFYVNGKQAEVGAGTYIIKNNDTIEWKIETY